MDKLQALWAKFRALPHNTQLAVYIALAILVAFTLGKCSG